MNAGKWFVFNPGLSVFIGWPSIRKTFSSPSPPARGVEAFSMLASEFV
jgi:hypothetical protein